MKKGFTWADGTTSEDWQRYHKAMKAWRKRYKGKMGTMEASMMEPNEPGYFRANND